jgi:hypothetical protein
MRYPRPLHALIALAITGVALAIIATPANAAATRAEYVAQIDPICQSALARESATLKRFTRRVKRIRRHNPDVEVHPTKPFLRTVSAGYRQLAGEVSLANGQITPIAPAPGDELTASRWMQDRTAFAQAAQRAGQLIAHGALKRFLRAAIAMVNYEAAAREVIAGFGFTYCSKAPPGFGGE